MSGSEAEAPVAGPAAAIIEPRRDILESAVQFMTLKVRFSRTVDEAEKMLREEKHSTSHNPLWIPMREVTIVPKLTGGQSSRQLRKYYTPVKTSTGLLYAVMQYSTLQGIYSEPSFGILQALFKYSGHGGLKVALVRVLEETAPDAGNERVVYDHGNKRFKYKISTLGDVQMELVNITDITRLAMIVPDTYDIAVRHGLRASISNLPDTLEERLLSRFFNVLSFQFTSFPEWRGTLQLSLPADSIN